MNADESVGSVGRGGGGPVVGVISPIPGAVGLRGPAWPALPTTSSQMASIKAETVTSRLSSSGSHVRAGVTAASIVAGSAGMVEKKVASGGEDAMGAAVAQASATPVKVKSKAELSTLDEQRDRRQEQRHQHPRHQQHEGYHHDQQQHQHHHQHHHQQEQSHLPAQQYLYSSSGAEVHGHGRVFDQSAAASLGVQHLDSREMVMPGNGAVVSMPPPLPPAPAPTALSVPSAVRQAPLPPGTRPKKCFVGNLGWGTNERTLADYFSQYCMVTQVKIIRDRHTGVSRGYGFVTLASPPVADWLIAQTTLTLEGRTINVNECNPTRSEQQQMQQQREERERRELGERTPSSSSPSSSSSFSSSSSSSAPTASEAVVTTRSSADAAALAQGEETAAAIEGNSSGTGGVGCKVFVGGLDGELTEAEVTAALADQFGPVVGLRVIRDSLTGRCKGYGFATFAGRGSGEAAIAAGSIRVQGKSLRLGYPLRRQQSAHAHNRNGMHAHHAHTGMHHHPSAVNVAHLHPSTHGQVQVGVGGVVMSMPGNPHSGHLAPSHVHYAAHSYAQQQRRQQQQQQQYHNQQQYGLVGSPRLARGAMPIAMPPHIQPRAHSHSHGSAGSLVGSYGSQGHVSHLQAAAQLAIGQQQQQHEQQQQHLEQQELQQQQQQQQQQQRSSFSQLGSQFEQRQPQPSPSSIAEMKMPSFNSLSLYSDSAAAAAAVGVGGSVTRAQQPSLGLGVGSFDSSSLERLISSSSSSSSSGDAANSAAANVTGISLASAAASSSDGRHSPRSAHRAI